MTHLVCSTGYTCDFRCFHPPPTPPGQTRTCRIAVFTQQEADEKFWSIIRQNVSQPACNELGVFFRPMCLLVCTALSWFDPCWPHLHHGAGHSPGRSPSLLRSNRRKSCCRWVCCRHFCKHCWTRRERSLPAAFQEPAGKLQRHRVVDITTKVRLNKIIWFTSHRNCSRTYCCLVTTAKEEKLHFWHELTDWEKHRWFHDRWPEIPEQV